MAHVIHFKRMQRRALLELLELRPRDLHPLVTGSSIESVKVQVSDILAGQQDMKPEHAAAFARLVGKRAVDLFCGRS